MLMYNACFNTISGSMGKKESISRKSWVSGSKVSLADQVISNWSKTDFSQRLVSCVINNGHY